MCGDATSRPAALPDGGPFPKHMRLCHLCEDRWLDFQCRALELRRRAEEAVARLRGSGGKLSRSEGHLINEGLALLVAFFFRDASEEGFGTGKIREVFHFGESIPIRILRRLEHSGAVVRWPGRPGRAGGFASSSWVITPAGEREIARFFLLLTRLDTDPSVMLDSTHLLGLVVRGAGTPSAERGAERGGSRGCQERDAPRDPGGVR